MAMVRRGGASPLFEKKKKGFLEEGGQAASCSVREAGRRRKA